MKFFLRISRFSDLNWKSYRLPEDAEWREYESLEEMIEEGAYQTDGLAGIEWNKPFVEETDVVFPAGHPIGEIEEDITVADLVRDGFIVRVYSGEKLEDLQDGVIFRPVPVSEEEAKSIMDQYEYFEIYPENYERGLLDVMAPTYCPYEIAWNLSEGSIPLF